MLLNRPVAWIRYSVKANDQLDPLALTHESSAFRLVVGAGEARFEFREPPYSWEEAQRRVLEFLSSFEADLLLQTGPIRREFNVSGAGFVGGGVLGPMATLKVKVGGPLAEANTRRQFPWRFHRFEGDALITALVQRYEDFRRNRDRLLSTAFFVLTALESVFGGRSALRSQLAVERRVINHFAEFVSEFGSLGTARKIRAKYKGQDLTSAQAYWLECTLRQLLLRAGQYRSGNLPTSSLSMSQLPPL